MLRALVLWICLSLTAAGAETLVVFTSRRCGPCRHFHADYQRDPGMTGSRNVRLVDVADSQDEAAKYRIGSVPTFVLEGGGAEIRRTTGYSGPAALKAWLEGH